MAYIDQTKKAEIAAKLKAIMPKGWKYSLSIHNHTSLRMKITEAPVDMVTMIHAVNTDMTSQCFSVNEHWYRRHLVNFPEEVLALFDEIFKALNYGNHDNSDIQSDYFDVGWYTHLEIGTWDKPFKYTGG